MLLASAGAAGAIAALTASASVDPVIGNDLAGSPSGVVTSQSVTITASGGTAPYTYSWTITSGDVDYGTPTINNPTSATTTFSDTVNDSLSIEGASDSIARCRVTDNVAATYDVFVDVQLTNAS